MPQTEALDEMETQLPDMNCSERHSTFGPDHKDDESGWFYLPLQK